MAPVIALLDTESASRLGAFAKEEGSWPVKLLPGAMKLLSIDVVFQLSGRSPDKLLLDKSNFPA